MVFELGVYLVTGELGVGAIVVGNGKVIGFPATKGVVHREEPFYTSVASLSASSTLRKVNNPTIQEAADAFKENRQPRWLIKE